MKSFLFMKEINYFTKQSFIKTQKLKHCLLFITIFKQGHINWSKVTVKTFKMLQKY